MLLQLTDHVSRNDLLERNQSAYRQNHSTETALLHITNCLLESTDQGRVSILSLLDLSAAFDTIDHNILLERLHTTFGISGSALQWLRSYILGQISGRCCKQHLIHPTTPGLWGPSEISVGTIALCSLYTARFTHCPPVRFWPPQVFGRYTAFQFCPSRWFWYPYQTDRDVCRTCQGLDGFQQTQT